MEGGKQGQGLGGGSCGAGARNAVRRRATRKRKATGAGVETRGGGPGWVEPPWPEKKPRRVTDCFARRGWGGGSGVGRSMRLHPPSNAKT